MRRMMSFRVNDQSNPSISSHHLKGANVIFGDGSHRFLSESSTADQLRALFTIAGGEPVAHD